MVKDYDPNDDDDIDSYVYHTAWKDFPIIIGSILIIAVTIKIIHALCI